mmetsp:Transcript_16213/g.31390  ORF Transcript_16213/g.31390 Transcript_16213/m.31390 type:complete len:720 (+) Transcript_16213:549-2708(+)
MWQDFMHVDPCKGRLLTGESEDESFTWLELYSSLAFMISLWVVGKLASLVKAPPLVGQIIIGMILGPNLVDFVPKVGAWKLVGEVGLMLLVIEAGLEVDLEMLRLIGLRGALVAVLGSMVPFALGNLIGSQILGLDMKASFVLGASLSPTSMGISLSVLRASKLLNAPTGQLIIAAAVLDDILALVLLSELGALQDPTPWNFIKPVFSALMLLLGFGVLAIFVIPPILNRLVFPNIRREYEESFALGLLLLVAMGLAPAAHASGGSYLLGCFISGVSFCTSEQVKTAWTTQVKRILAWLLRIFFGCSIAFEVPVRSFASAVVVRNAFLFLIALFGKIATCIWARPLNKFNAMVIAAAMCALGEFAFIVVVNARQQGYIEDDLAASIILTILLCILGAPTCLRLIILYFTRKAEEAVSKARDETSEGAQGSPPLYYFVQTRCSGSVGLQDRVLRAILQPNIEIVDIRSFHPRINDCNVEIIYEAFLCDHGMHLPALRYRVPNPDEEDEIRTRLHQIYELVYNALRDPHHGVVRVGRWYAGIRCEDDNEVAVKAAFDLAGKIMEARHEDYDISVTRNGQSDQEYGLGGFVHRQIHDIDFLGNDDKNNSSSSLSGSKNLKKSNSTECSQGTCPLTNTCTSTESHKSMPISAFSSANPSANNRQHHANEPFDEGPGLLEIYQYGAYDGTQDCEGFAHSSTTQVEEELHACPDTSKETAALQKI